jgi:hypothetical protein
VLAQLTNSDALHAIKVAHHVLLGDVLARTVPRRLTYRHARKTTSEQGERFAKWRELGVAQTMSWLPHTRSRLSRVMSWNLPARL